MTREDAEREQAADDQPADEPGEPAADDKPAAEPAAEEAATDEPAAEEPAAEEQIAGESAAGESAAGGKPGGARRAGESGTAAAAAQARAVMQHRHLRIGFAMTAAVGAEVIGAAGMVAGGLLPWEWDERLWGRTDQPGILLQAALALAVLALALAWYSGSYPVRTRSRTFALLPAAAVAGGAVAVIWQADLGSRGAGGLVTGAAAVVAVAGAVGWLVGLRRLRVLFPFGLADARSSGFGNLAAVRRARLVGGPAGGVGGVVVVAGALLVGPGLVTTEDTGTADPLALGGQPPTAGGGEPTWELTLPAGSSSTITATPGGLVIGEVRGVRVVDPRDGAERWHWRDEAYRLVTAAVTDGGGTVVLALDYEGEQAGRDRVVALATATGEVRWDRQDDDLVAAMTTAAIAPEEGDWFVVPEQVAPPEGQPPEQAAQAPVRLRVVGSDDGRTRWEATERDGCRFVSVNGDAPGVVVAGQECTGDGGAPGGCLVTGLDPVTGDERWSWPPDGPDPDLATGCQATPRGELVFVTHQAAQQSAVALDPGTGAEVWTTDTVNGLTAPVVVGDAVVGAEPAGDGSGTGGVLVIRDAADGQVRTEVPLPPGQPIEVAPVSDEVAAISHYRTDTTEVMLLEVDVGAGEVAAESRVLAAPADGAFQRVGLAVGPQTLAVDALVGPGQPAGQQAGQGDLTLHVHGYG